MQQAKPSSAAALVTLIVCGLLLATFACISFSAVRTKNATIDEPAHAMSGWMELRHGDFRMEPVNPPLWKCWAALGNLFAKPPIRYDAALWNDQSFDPSGEVIWASQILYDSPGFDGAAFVNRARAMMLLVALGLGALISWWSFRIAGPIAAISATALFCLDPTVLGHASLVKSDIAFALAMLGLAYTLWKLGQRATIRRLLLAGVLCGVVINIKFSGVIAGPMLAIVLFCRAMDSKSWEVCGRSFPFRFKRFAAAVSIGLWAALCCVIVTWACYGFRYRPAESPTVRMDMSAIVKRAALVEIAVELNRTPTLAEFAAHPPGTVTRFVCWADNHHLLPQAMLAGLLYQHTCVQSWPAFLDGERYGSGRWNYFLLAFFYKTPLAELSALGLSAMVLILAAARLRAYKGDRFQLRWTLACLLIPSCLFLIAAITTHLNIGLRNLLPLYPFLYIGSGCAAAIAARNRPRLTTAIAVVLAAGLLHETLCTWPDYIAFFNKAAGGERGGILHLSDSNLDWGQDIKSLASWQREHQAMPLYARLYRTVDPKFYGLVSHPLEIHPHAQFSSDQPIVDGYIAVSATHLQGLYIKDFEEDFYRKLQNRRPVAIIGGSIYVYKIGEF